MVEIERFSSREQISLVNNISRSPKDLLRSDSPPEREADPKSVQDLLIPDVDLTDSKKAPARTGEKEATCSDNADYLKFINKAARNMYDPASLGELKKLKSKYNCEIKNTDDAIYYADLALLNSEDQYNDVLPEKQAVKQRQEWSGEISGIGVKLKEPANGSGPIEVHSVIDGGPSAGKDIGKGDVITHVNGESLESVAYEDALEKIRGPVGSDVELTVVRNGEPHNVEIKRNKIEIENIEHELLKDNIAYIRLKDFNQQDTVEDVQKVLQQYAGASAIIFDIRYNGGGLLNQGIQLPSLFLNRGPLLSTRNRIDSDPLHPKYGTVRYDLTDKEISLTIRDAEGIHKEAMKRFKDIVHVPFAVMVNGGTGSSAEITAAAFQADQEGTLIGSRTFGKGISQTVFRGMPGGSSLKVTTARFYSPKENRWIGDGFRNRIGIQPDIVVHNPPDAKLRGEKDFQFHAAIKFLKDKINHGHRTL